jgi:hypothetical protein
MCIIKAPGGGDMGDGPSGIGRGRLQQILTSIRTKDSQGLKQSSGSSATSAQMSHVPTVYGKGRDIHFGKNPKIQGIQDKEERIAKIETVIRHLIKEVETNPTIDKAKVGNHIQKLQAIKDKLSQSKVSKEDFDKIIHYLTIILHDTTLQRP